MDNIREAVEVLEEIIEEDSSMPFQESEEYMKCQENKVTILIKLKNFLQSYLSIEGFPEEKAVTKKCNDLDDSWNHGYNFALKECKLALMKMFSEGDIKWCIDRLNESVLYVRNEKNKEYRFNNEAIVHLNIIQRVQGVLGAIHNLTNGGLK